MKKTLFAATLLSFVFAFTACDTEDPLDGENCIRVRMVSQLCGQAVLQVLSPEHFSIAESAWVDGNSNGTEYRNVFGTVFTCEDEQNLPAIGETFNVRLIEDPGVNECIRCQALLVRPQTQYFVKIVDENCTDSSATDN